MEKVKVYQEKKPIKTYQIGDPDINPFISEYLGSLLFYPYPLKDKISNKAGMVEYKLFCLENDYFKVSFLPDLGGKLYSAVDKRYDNNIFYTNPVVKPQLVGCTGAWTSGGIEFNFPNRGHRPTATDYTDTICKKYEDGSAAIIINDIDMISWQRFSVEFKLYPDKAYMEQIVRMYNPNDYTDSYYFWTTSAELEKEGLEYRYPFLWHIEEEERKKYLWPFPEDSPFAAEGVDLRYSDTMKAFTLPFGCEVLKDYMGLYYPDEDGGVVHVADYRQVPGKKVWSWGTASAGKIWCQRLTDNDDRYVELQTGAVETQNEFNLLEPHNQVEYREYWLYSKNIGPLGAASKDVIASYHLEESGSSGGKGREARIKFRLLGTDRFKDLKFVLLAGDEEVFAAEIELDTVESTEIEVPFVLSWMERDIEFIIKNDKMVLLREVILENDEALETIDREEYIAEDEERESRFARALFFEKRRFYNNAVNLYNEIIEDNPEYIQAYLRKANCYFKKRDYQKALEVMEEVIGQNPEDRELDYYYALALWYNGSRLKARKYFFKVPNSSKYFAAASYFLSLYHVTAGRYEKALPVLEYSQEHQPFHYKSFLLYAYALLKTGRDGEAEGFLREYLAGHPMDYVARYLYEELTGETDNRGLILSQSQNVYHILSFFDELEDRESCLKLLEQYSEQESPFALLKAYRHYYSGGEGDNTGWREELIEAVEEMELDYVFPNHPIDLKILEKIVDVSPNARYLYGLLQYRAENYDRVKEAWLSLVEEDFPYSVLYRNLAYYYQKHEGDYEKSRELAEKGFPRKPFNNDFFYLLYRSYERLGLESKLEELLDSIEEFEDKSEPCIRVWIDMLNRLGRHEKAARILENTDFNMYEHDPENIVPYSKIYRETYLGLAREALAGRDYDRAWDAIDHCLKMEKRYEEKFSEIYFYAGLIKEKTGEFKEALAFYQRIFAEDITRDDEDNYPYYVKAAHRMVKLNWIGIEE